MTKTARAHFVSRLTMAIMLALLLAFMFKGVVTHPPNVAETKRATGFDGDRAVARLANILGDQRPHPVDSLANDAVRSRLLAEITALGYAPEVRDDQICRGSERWNGMSCARVRNIVFRAGPSGGNGVLVASHYDSVPAGPGAADDGAGVAATLEIAALLKSQNLKKPVVFLITDGEEAGLLGAASFVRKDPYASDIALAINMEARGTGGPAIMFQTSMPNSREIAAFTHGPLRTVANSLAADIYRLLPNDTDATLFLERKYNLLNFAFISPLARYHTTQDNLANLETASVAHMGAAGLAAIEGYLAGKSDQRDEEQLIYSDLLGHGLLVLPQWAGWALLAFGFAAAGFQFMRAPKGGFVRSLLAPLLAVVLSGAMSFGLLFVINQVRTEEAWWSTYPVFARGVVYGASVLAAGIAVWLCQSVSRQRLISSAWLWLAGAFLGIGFVAPGAMILIAPASGLFGLWVIANQFWKKLDLLHSAWALALIVLVFPTLDFAEVGLGFEMGWALSGLAALVSLPLLAAALPTNSVTKANVAAKAALVSCLAAAAGLVPAYSPLVPRPLNLSHVHEEAKNHWLISPDDEPAPQAMQTIAPFAKGPLTGNAQDRLIALAPNISTSPAFAGLEVIDDQISGAARVLSVRISAPDADEVVLNLPASAKVTSMGLNTTDPADVFSFMPDTPKGLRCVGRSCASWELKFVVGTAKTDWTITTTRRGQGPEGQPLLQARPAWAAPIQGGDRRMSVRVQGV